MSTDPGTGEQVRLGFLARLLADREVGESHPLAFYLPLYPGHEEAIAEEYAGRPATSPDVPANIGPYRVLREVGRGGQAIVYLAEDERLRRRVALKVLTGFGPAAAEILRRFRREAEVASRLDHPGICTVHEAGAVGMGAFIAMQFVDGVTLAAVLRAATAPPRGPDLTRVLRICEGIARALHAAHEAGIVHRDVKPGNVMVTPAGEPVILDFGLAREVDSDLPTLTRTGDLLGTPAYMSPEQVAGRPLPLDRQSDVFSLGVTLYECVTLRRPFDAPTAEAIGRRILDDEAADPRRLNPAVPRDLVAVLAAALQKDRARRYRTALDLAEDLRRIREGLPVAVHEPSTLDRAIHWARRRPAHAALASLAFVVVGIAGFLVAKWPAIVAGGRQQRSARAAVFVDRGYIACEEHAYDDAADWFRRALAEEPELPEAASGAVFVPLTQRRPEAALAMLDGFAGLERRWPALGRLRVHALEEAGRIEEARRIDEQLGPPRDALAFFVEGLRELARGDQGREASFAAAARAFEQAVLHSRQAQALYHFKWAGAAGRAHDAQSARRAADAVLDLWPDSSAAMFYAAYALQEVDVPRAILLFQRALADAQDDARIQFNLGNALRGAARGAEAEQAYRRAIERHPGYVGAIVNLANLLTDRGDLAEAHELLRRATALQPDSADAWYNLGCCLDAMHAVGEALAAFRKAIELRPQHAAAGNNLGALLGREGRLDEAVEALRAALRLRPADHDLWLNLGAFLLATGDAAAALEATRTAAALRPDSAAAWKNLAIVLEQADGSDAEKLEAWRKAVELEPGTAPLRSHLLESLRRSGRFRDALDAAAQAETAGFRGEHAVVSAEWRTETVRLAGLEDVERTAMLAVRAGTTAAPASGAAPGELRRQGLHWLRRNLEQLRALRADGMLGDALFQQILRRWLDDPGLAPFRADAAPDRFPADEWREWEAFWSDVHDALAGSK